MYEILRNVAWVFCFLVGCLWVWIGVLLVGLGWSTLRKLILSARWPRVPVRIVATEINTAGRLDDHHTFQPVVRYTFAAGGQEVTGTQLAFVGKLYPTEDRARKDIDKFPVGMVVMAYCHPQDPAEVVLERSGLVAGIFLLLLGVALMVSALIVAARFGLPVWPLAAIVAAVVSLALLLDRASRSRLQRARRAGLYPGEGQGDDGDVERLLRQGEKLLAIRLYRELHGTDLKTARRRVEEMQQNLVSDPSS